MIAHKLRVVLLLAAVSIGAAAQACSTSSSSGTASCADDPNKCAPGTTCWPKDCTCPSGGPCGAANCTPHLECLPSVSGKNPHDSCSNKIGQATCSDHQACVEIQSGFGGCLLYCNDALPNRGCPAGESCYEKLRVGGTPDSPLINVCAVPLGGADGGGSSGTIQDSGTVSDARSELPM